ncbi:MAG: SGNH/GDSL hydrolase family protein [Armatimonadetes bacterium]|nr:SGNH/GDSL hydrolase family protein [Candidatus Hippobium faecium]
MKKILLSLAIICLALSLCAKTETIKGESFVAVKNYPTKLAFDHIKKGSVSVRNSYDSAYPDKNYTNAPFIVYEEGKDYVIDYEKGTVSRCEGSRIPDYVKNDVARMKVFNHGDPGLEFANYAYQTYIDYTTENYTDMFEKTGQAKYLPKTLKALKKGTPIKYVAYGDSITAGGDTTRPENIYFNRWIQHLKTKYRKADITVVNGATGGDTSYQGMERLDSKCLAENPNLVSIGFGMNDNNTISYMSQEQYESYLQNMVDRIKAHNPDCEIIILSSYNPKDNWFYNSHKMSEFTATAQKVAKKNRLAFVNIEKAMQAFFDIKGQSSMLGNNINHPTDFGHWVWFKQLEAATF